MKKAILMSLVATALICGTNSFAENSKKELPGTAITHPAVDPDIKKLEDEAAKATKEGKPEYAAAVKKEIDAKKALTAALATKDTAKIKAATDAFNAAVKEKDAAKTAKKVEKAK